MSTIEYLAAGNLATSREYLAQLALSEVTGVRRRVAENPNCPTGALQALAEDPSPDVRSTVGGNPKASFALLRMLAKDFCINVRYTLAEDHNLPRPLLRMLGRDDNAYVAERAKLTLSHLKEEQSARRKANYAEKHKHAVG